MDRTSSSYPSAFFKTQAAAERLGLAAFGLLVPLLIVPTAEDAFRLPQLISLSIVVLLLGLSWSRSLRWSVPVGMGLGYFALRLASHTLTASALSSCLESCLYAFLYFWALAHLGERVKRQRLQSSLLAAAALISLYSIFQAYGIDLLHLGSPSLGFGARPAATLGNPDFLGAYLALMLPLALLAWLEKGQRLWLLGLIVFALLLTQTRAAWLAAAVATGLLVVGLAYRMAWRPLGLRLLTLLILPLILLVPGTLPQGVKLVERAASSFQVHGDDAGGRFFMGRVAWNITLQHPWLGAGDFSTAYLEEQGRLLALPAHAAEAFRLTHDAHNDWIQLAAESGIFAPLLLLLLLAMAVRRSSLEARSLLAAFAVNAMFNFPLSIPACAAIVFIVLGAQLAEADSPRQELPWLALLGFVAFFVFGRQLQSSVLLNRGTSYSLLKRSAEARPYLLKASSLQSDDVRVWMRLGLDADQAGELPLATLAFRHAVDSLPSLPEANANYGLLLAKQGRLDEAKAYSLRALALNPRSTEALGNLGKIEYLKGDLAAAEAAYLKGLSLDEGWTQGHFNLAAIYINTRRHREARRELKALLAIEPTNAEAARLLKGLP